MGHSVQGMTGYGAVERGGFRVEIRSLNHRYMEAAIKLPPQLFAHEQGIREALKARFARGRFDVYVSAQGAGETALHVDQAGAARVKAALTALNGQLMLGDEVALGHILQWRDLLIKEETSYDDAELGQALAEALDQTEAMRLKEGAALYEELMGRAGEIERLRSEIAAQAPAIMRAAREAFVGRIRTVLVEAPHQFDEGRLAQEAAAIADRSDVSEEISRLGNHLAHMREILEGGGPVGRKLDFLMQELIRESNTIASKSGDYGVLKNVIEMKSEIEKTREQVQNLE